MFLAADKWSPPPQYVYEIGEETNGKNELFVSKYQDASSAVMEINAEYIIGTENFNLLEEKNLVIFFNITVTSYYLYPAVVS